MGQVRDVHLTAQKRAYQMEAANQDGSRDVTGHVPVDPTEETSHIVDFHLNHLVFQLVGDEEERQQMPKNSSVVVLLPSLCPVESLK